MERIGVFFSVLVAILCCIKTVSCQQTAGFQLQLASCRVLQCDAGLQCEYGHVYDERACRICECKLPTGPTPRRPSLPWPSPRRPPLPGPRCPPVCMIYCEFGNVMDARGCPTCRCNPGPGPIPSPICPSGSRPLIPRQTCGRLRRCPVNSFCVPSPVDRGGTCCRRRRILPPNAGPGPIPSPRCPSGSRPLIPRQTCGLLRRCPVNSFCVPSPVDRGGTCCRRRRILPPIDACRHVNWGIRCFRHWDQCNRDRDCGQAQRCCPGPCGRVCQRRMMSLGGSVRG